MLVTPPIEAVELEALKLLHLTLSPPLLRFLGIIIHLISSLVFAKLAGKLVGKGKLIYSVAFLVFFFSPWTSFLSTFYLIQNLLLFVFLILVGRKKILLVLLILIPTLFFLSKLYGKDYSSLKTLSPSNLTFEINESQRINFLSVERKFILPYPLRVFIYNEPGLVLIKAINQFISFFDIEHLTAPDKTYEIIKLSGISPKGILMLLYIWEIPLIAYGFFQWQNKKYLGLLFLISIIPFLFFEKKLLAQTAFLAAVPLFLFEVIGIAALIKRIDKKFVLPAVLIASVSVFGFFKTLYFKPLSYQPPQPYLFREIARWLTKNYDPGKNYVVTTRFGSTDTLIPYYLGKNQPNLTFKAFDLTADNAEANTVYIGLAGEFVKPGKDIEDESPNGGIELIDKISGEDEPVFNYGTNIWIGYSK